MKLTITIKEIPVTNRKLCLVPHCANAAAPDGFCLTCKSCLSGRRREKLKNRPGKLRRWLTFRRSARLVWGRHQQRGRN